MGCCCGSDYERVDEFDNSNRYPYDKRKQKSEYHQNQKPEWRLQDYTLANIVWWVEPLHNAAKYVDGQHSKIQARFTDNYHSTPDINLIVERYQDGVFRAKKVGKDKYRKPSYMSLKENVYLQDFLNKCIKENKKTYQLNKADCHCFARAMWDFCIEFDPDERKPNIILTTVGQAINSKLPKGSTLKLTRITAFAPPKGIQRSKEKKIVEKLLKSP
eukprot:243851_1